VRSDNVISLCEIKYHNKPISINVIQEIENKSKLIQIPQGYTLEKALISRFGPDKALKQSNYFHHYVNEDDFFK